MENKVMYNQYENMLKYLLCNKCSCREVCFLRKVSLYRYPEQVQRFVLTLPKNIFLYQEHEKRWHADYYAIQEQLVQYYNSHNGILIGKEESYLTYEEQRKVDRQRIREQFKQLLNIAARRVETTNPEASIIFDRIGLVLASDYIEAVNKIFSMMKTFIKYDSCFA